MHVEPAHKVVGIGAPSPEHSYVSIASLLEVAGKKRAEAIHPGYGFLIENAVLAEASAGDGVVFMGPTLQQMKDFGLKHVARRIAAENSVPLLPGSELLEDLRAAIKAAERIGYPVMLKSTAGGGGIGIRLCGSAEELREAFDAVARLSQANFGSGGVYLEKFVSQARHIEVQIFGDGRGSVAAQPNADPAAAGSTLQHHRITDEFSGF